MAAPSRKPPGGSALLEVIVALTVLATAGLSLAVFASDAGYAVSNARRSERDLRRADAFLSAVSLWPRDDLDRHLGERAEGPWRLVVLRPSTTLYTVALIDSATSRPLLSTALYRPDTSVRGRSHAP